MKQFYIINLQYLLSVKLWAFLSRKDAKEVEAMVELLAEKPPSSATLKHKLTVYVSFIQAHELLKANYEEVKHQLNQLHRQIKVSHSILNLFNPQA